MERKHRLVGLVGADDVKGDSGLCSCLGEVGVCHQLDRQGLVVVACVVLKEELKIGCPEGILDCSEKLFLAGCCPCMSAGTEDGDSEGEICSGTAT